MRALCTCTIYREKILIICTSADDSSLWKLDHLVITFIHKLHPHMGLQGLRGNRGLISLGIANV